METQNEEKWNDNGFVGTIRVFEEERKPLTEYENLDDYDVRHKVGCRVHTTHSRFEREEM